VVMNVLSQRLPFSLMIHDAFNQEAESSLWPVRPDADSRASQGLG
jgi:hypothetical protein